MNKEALSVVDTFKMALEALDQLTNAADTFSVSGVYFNEEVWAKKCLSDAYFAINAIEQTLAQQNPQGVSNEQVEPVAKVNFYTGKIEWLMPVSFDIPVTIDVPPMYLYTTPPQPKEPEQEPVDLECYDAGLLGSGGGGDVDWWQDYIRAELGRAHEHYQSQITTPPQRKPLTDEQIDAVMPQPTEFGIVQPPWNGSDITILRAMSRAIEAAHGIKE